MDKTFGAGQKFRIVPKRDFGRYPHLINGEYVKSGFVVTRGGANIMPGATWFRSVEDAMRGIKAFQESETASEFWAKVRA